MNTRLNQIVITIVWLTALFNLANSIAATHDPHINRNVQTHNSLYSPNITVIPIRNHYFKIPGWYIAQYVPGNRDFVSLFVYWPNMEPFRKIYKTRHNKLDRVEILLDGRWKKSTVVNNKRLKRIESNGNYIPKIFNQTLGLWEYRSRHELSDKIKSWHYVVPGNDNKKNIHRLSIIDCGGPMLINGEENSIQCSADYFYKDIRLTYRYYYKNISAWKNIDDEVVKLVKSFVSVEKY